MSGPHILNPFSDGRKILAERDRVLYPVALIDKPGNLKEYLRRGDGDPLNSKAFFIK
jgi:hypothetical protein